MGRFAEVSVDFLGGGASRPDRVAVEEPLEIRLGDDPLAVTLRTPGDDFDLAAGFLFTERILLGREDLLDLGYCLDPRHPELRNIVKATLAHPVDELVERARRRSFVPSSCGLCGKGSIEAVMASAPPIADPVKVSREVLAALPDALRKAQPTFSETGGLHAAGLFDAAGAFLVAREDIGRHNAVDKVVGRMLLDRRSMKGTVLMISGRASFEIVQKALAAGIPVVAAVSAPSSMAVELARSSGITLVGFLREGGGNVYAGGGRVV